MTAIQQLQAILSECQLDQETLIYLMQQGIEVEQMKLEYLETTRGKSLDAFIKIMQGERFLSLLIGAQ